MAFKIFCSVQSANLTIQLRDLLLCFMVSVRMHTDSEEKLIIFLVYLFLFNTIMA